VPRGQVGRAVAEAVIDVRGRGVVRTGPVGQGARAVAVQLTVDLALGVHHDILHFRLKGLQEGALVRAGGRNGLAADVDARVELLHGHDGALVALLSGGRQRAALSAGNTRRRVAARVQGNDEVATLDRGDFLFHRRQQRGGVVQQFLEGRKVDFLEDVSGSSVIKSHGWLLSMRGRD